MNRYNALSRLNNLTIATRISIGFGAIFALVFVFATTGVIALNSIIQSINPSLASATMAQTAAGIDIGIRDLEVAVRDHLAASDPSTQAEAQRQYGDLSILITTLADQTAQTNGAEAMNATRKALDGYWESFEQIIALRNEQTHLLTGDLASLVTEATRKLDEIRAAGGLESAALASDAAAKVRLVQELAQRYTIDRDPKDAQAMRAALAAASDRLVKLNRFLWVPGTRQSITGVRTMLQGGGGILDRLEELLVQEDRLRFQTLGPKAATVSAHATEMRKQSESLTTTLHHRLTKRAAAWMRQTQWTGGILLLLSALITWVLVRSSAQATGAGSIKTASSQTAAAPERPVDNHPAPAPLAPEPAPAVSDQPINDGADESAAMAWAAPTPRAVDTALGATSHSSAPPRSALEQFKQEAQLAQAALVAARERAEAKDFAKSNFLVNRGQELHRPLSDIIHQSQSLMSELHRLGAGELATDMEQIQWSGEQLVSLIDSILDYAKIEAGMMDVILQDFEVEHLLTEVRERSMAHIDLNGNTLWVSGTAALGSMHQDFVKVRQILLNLVDNAGKFTHNGSVVLSAERADHDGYACVRFMVSDTGCGFPASQAGHMFQPFTQGKANGGGKIPGAGLGLTLVGHYTAMLGGSLELTSEPGHGTRVTLILPALYQPLAEDRPLLEQDGGKLRPLLTVTGQHMLPQPADD